MKVAWCTQVLFYEERIKERNRKFKQMKVGEKKSEFPCLRVGVLQKQPWLE